MENKNNELAQNTEKFDNAHIAELSKMTKNNRDNLKLQREEDEAIDLGNKPREASAKRMYEQSKNKEIIEAERGQKLIARRAFLKGVLVSTGVIATVAVGIEAVHTNTQKIKEAKSKAAKKIYEKAKKQATIDAAYKAIAPKLLNMLNKSSVNKFKESLNGTTIEKYSEYLLYRLIEENELYNYGNNLVNADECLEEINAIRMKVIADANQNKNLYEGYNVPDHSDYEDANRYNADKVDNGAIDVYFDTRMDAETFRTDVDIYQMVQEQKNKVEKGASR